MLTGIACEDFREYVLDYYTGLLDRVQAKRMDLHQLRCAECAAS